MHELVVRAREGDRDAFSELAARSIGRLTAVARLILRDEYAAQDAVQAEEADQVVGLAVAGDRVVAQAAGDDLAVGAASHQVRKIDAVDGAVLRQEHLQRRRFHRPAGEAREAREVALERLRRFLRDADGSDFRGAEDFADAVVEVPGITNLFVLPYGGIATQDAGMVGRSTLDGRVATDTNADGVTSWQELDGSGIIGQVTQLVDGNKGIHAMLPKHFVKS